MIGLGLIGTALAARLIDARIPVIGVDIDTASCSAFGEIGGESAASIRDVMARCRSIVVAVYSGAQAQSLFDEIGPPSDLSPALMICVTTCAPHEIASIAERAEAARLLLVEAPLSGTSAEVREGSATALVAGRPPAIEAAGSLLDVLCPRQMRVGPIGDAARIKLAINLILQANRAALAEGIAFAEATGLDGATFLAIAKQSAAYSRVMDSKGARMVARDFTPQSRIAQTLKDAELILQEGARCGQVLPMTSVQAGLLRETIARLGEDCDSTAIIEAIRASDNNSGAAP
jgi:3-hydroxyisobutyrate dehydrogenase-like beta-hydroxyacid dehydrogenase